VLINGERASGSDGIGGLDSPHIPPHSDALTFWSVLRNGVGVKIERTEMPSLTAREWAILDAIWELDTRRPLRTPQTIGGRRVTLHLGCSMRPDDHDTKGTR
jgi:hypothetical protein